MFTYQQCHPNNQFSLIIYLMNPILFGCDLLDFKGEELKNKQTKKELLKKDIKI